MKFQLCWYKEKGDHEQRLGLARMNSSFDSYDVAYILDAETGHRPKTIWSYNLVDLPLSRLDATYSG